MNESPAHFASLTPMIAPRSVAILGASTDPTRIGGRPIAYMKRRGFAGRILPVNPNRAEVQGLPAWPSVAALPEVPDVAILALSASLAEAAMGELAASGVKTVIALSAGFAEVDEAGAAAQARLVAIARKAGMRLLGPNCLGLFNDRIGFYPMFSASLENGWPVPGPIGIASQSGAFATHVFGAMRDRGIGAQLCVTTGNEAEVTLADVIGWMAEDPETEVIAAYAEGIADGPGFIAALAAARAARKPVVMMKVGRSARGSAAARSHTGAIAGDDRVIDAVLAEFGAIRARTTEELIDIAYAATRRITPARNTLGVITISGGAGVLISDAAEAVGLAMPDMPEAAQAALKEAVPFSAPRNPVDCTAQIFNDITLVGRFADAMVEQGGYASILAFFSGMGAAPSMGPAARAQLRAVLDRHPDRLMAVSLIGPPQVHREYEADGFLVFEDPTRAVNALAAMGRLGAAFAAPPPAPLPPFPTIPWPATNPDEHQAKRLLAAAGIPAVEEAACATEQEAVAAAEAFGFPVVMKLLSPELAHKSEIGGVLLNIADADAVRAGHATLIARGRAAGLREPGILVARQVAGVECIMGIHRDPVFGSVALFGLGGVFVEILGDVALRRCPFGPAEAEAMIRSIRAAPLLTGARGRPPCDIAALAATLSRLSLLAHGAGPRLRSIDLNPVFARPDGCLVADAVIELDPDDAG